MVKFKLNPDQQRQPIGGPHYKIINGPLFRGETLKELVKKVSDYRIANLIQLGDPEQDILLDWFVKWPYMVMLEGEETKSEQRNGFVVWSSWIRKLWRNPHTKTLTTKEASERWQKCLTCPFNKEFDWSDTKESAAMVQKAFMLRRGIDIPKTLGYCGLHLWDIGVSSFIENPAKFSEKKQDQPQPSECWV